jgi:ABC-type molybdenum transport system ATPase subunit/photorepair protein PhrA
MARTDPHAAEVKELDAEALAALLVRHYGNEAPEVLSRALELARAKVAAWG